LPVQFGSDVVVYEIRENRAVAVEGEGEAVGREAEKLRSEPAYGNIAELGLGVLDDFGVQPCGSILLDEKLGLHIAFGRSDHFGGIVGPSDFSHPDAVVHIDRVYVPSMQPRVQVKVVQLEQEEQTLGLMADGKYLIDF
jgi:leucyl aminopeptidase (aminopeptidase T)